MKIPITLVCLLLFACIFEEENHQVEIPIFDSPQTISFAQNLSEYNIFQGNYSELVPSDSFHLIELISPLFTDYAQKQRLLYLPKGEHIATQEDGSLVYPDGSILTKTFYYHLDQNDSTRGKQIIETRLLIKQQGNWNPATYLWNEDQTEAKLHDEGLVTPIEWTDSIGSKKQTNYKVPSKNDCMACHQNKSSITYLGPTLSNTNKEVLREEQIVHQHQYFEDIGIFKKPTISPIPEIKNHSNPTESIEKRGRAYLAMNCAHCHNPNGW